MTTAYDVAVIGSGIIGLANAWCAAKRGLKVGVFERSPQPQGATVRNFGMVWPIGQPAGAPHEIAMRSREFWLELNQSGALNVEECGSIHLAFREDELAVLEEFVGLGSHDVQMLSAEEIASRSCIAKQDGLLGGMWSPTEARVDPRTAPSQIAAWLQEKFGVTLHWNTAVVEAGPESIVTGDGQEYSSGRAVICSGSDFETLFPSAFADSGLKRCKLQMLSCESQSAATSSANRAHLASGLTLRHYTSFQQCPSLPKLVERIQNESPELDQYGIHVMASHFDSGRVVLGDSHEYDDDISPFNKAEIDELMLRELRKLIHLEDWTVRERWSGIYAKHPTQTVYEDSPHPQVNILVGPGGAGMTLSFGLAEQAWQSW
ncbi:MAG: TIGR03364 family FAD-dependent oxidoreductase [Aureliella sp.]